MDEFDVAIIGSGPAGAQAADVLVKKGKSVVMIDGGKTGPDILYEHIEGTYDDIRKNDTNQYRFFLGEDLSSIPVNGLEGGLGGGMTSGNRSYAVEGVNDILPLKTENAQVIQNLAKGGFGAVWGAATAFLNREELTAMGLPAHEIEKEYDNVIRNIGISGTQNRPGIQPPLRPDHHAQAILNAYEKRKASLDDIAVVQPHSAILTEEKNGRQPLGYHDMDYYTDPGKSVYRPGYTIDELRTHDNFIYRDHQIVDRLKEDAFGVTIHSRSLDDQSSNIYRAKKVIVAAGAINTSRILLKSNNLIDTPIPFIGKTHAFTALLHLRMLGKAGPPERCSLCQLLVLDNKDGDPDGSIAQLYSYKSLQLFRLLGSAPFPVPEALNLLSLFAPSLIVADIRFPCHIKPNSTLTLNCNGEVIIRIESSLEDAVKRRYRMKRLHRAFRKLGLLPVRSMMLPEASSSHYAGTVPCTDGNYPLRSNNDGSVIGMHHTYVADSSMFRCQPAKPHTLTIMANARRVAKKLC